MCTIMGSHVNSGYTFDSNGFKMFLGPIEMNWLVFLLLLGTSMSVMRSTNPFFFPKGDRHVDRKKAGPRRVNPSGGSCLHTACLKSKARSPHITAATMRR